MTILVPGQFTTPSSTEHHAPDLRLCPVHLRMRLELDLEERTMQVELEHRIRCNSAGAHHLRLDAVELLDMSVEGQGVQHHYDGETVDLSWDKPFAMGEERLVTLRYQVSDPRSGLFFSGAEGDPDRPLFAATDHETERARYWLATVDYASVRPTLDMTLVVDSRFRALANGRLESESAEGSRMAFRWVLDSPCPSYLTCFYVGEMNEWRDSGEGLPIAAFAPAALIDSETLKRSFAPTRAMVDWIEKKLGSQFPYPKYYQFSVPFIGGAMENISLVSWDTTYLLDAEIEPEQRALTDIINLHELSHVWFGNHIVCRDQAHSWLKESWATYMESCWLEDQVGEEEAQYRRFIGAQKYFDECRQRYVRPIVTRTFDSSWDMYDYHLYPGGAWRLHMLRRRLGEETFWGAVREYVAQFGGATVETGDFRRILEKHSGRSLTSFFDAWVYAPGHPALKVRFRFDGAKKEGAFEIEQTQVRGAKKSSVQAFEFDLEVAWWNGDEEERATIPVRGRHTRHVVPMKSAPDRIAIDPNESVLHSLELDLGDVWLKAMMRDGDLRSRIHAARALAKKGNAKQLRWVGEAFGRETFWGAKAEFAKALGQTASDAAAQLLADLIESIALDDVRWIASLFEAAARHRHDRLGPAIRSRLEEGLPPIAAGAALEALGAQRHEEDIPRLEAASKEGHPVARKGALLALGKTASREAIEPLKTALRPGSHRSSVRLAAATGLGRLLPHLTKPDRRVAFETLLDTLRDPVTRVRSAAAAALVEAGDRGAIGALRQYAATLSAQDRYRLERGLRSLARGDALAGVHRRIDALEGEIRKLTARLDDKA